MRTPYQLDDLNYEGIIQAEIDLLFPEAKHLKRIFCEAKKTRAIINLCEGLCHYSWHDIDSF